MGDTIVLKFESKCKDKFVKIDEECKPYSKCTKGSYYVKLDVESTTFSY